MFTFHITVYVSSEYLPYTAVGASKPWKRSNTTTMEGSTDIWQDPTRGIGGAASQSPIGVPTTPTTTMAAGKRKLSLASALLGTKPARQLVSELEASRTASVQASMLARGRETTWDTGDEDEAETWMHRLTCCFELVGFRT